MSSDDEVENRRGVRSYIRPNKDTCPPHKKPRTEHRKMLQHNFEEAISPTAIPCRFGTKQLNNRTPGQVPPPPPNTRKPSSPFVPRVEKRPAVAASCQTEPMDQRELHELRAAKEQLAQSLAAARKETAERDEKIKEMDAKAEAYAKDKRRAVNKYHEAKDGAEKEKAELQAALDEARKAVLERDEEMDRMKTAEEERTLERVRIAVEAAQAESQLQLNAKDESFVKISAEFSAQSEQKSEELKNAKKVQKLIKKQRNDFRDKATELETKLQETIERDNALRKDNETHRTRIDSLLKDLGERDERLQKAAEERDEAIGRYEARDKAILDMENRLHRAESEANKWRMFWAETVARCPANPLQLPTPTALSPTLTPDGESNATR